LHTLIDESNKRYKNDLQSQDDRHKTYIREMNDKHDRELNKRDS